MKIAINMVFCKREDGVLTAETIEAFLMLLRGAQDTSTGMIRKERRAMNRERIKMN